MEGTSKTMLEELKSILKNYAKEYASYESQTEMESDEETEWHYSLKSSCPYAFHDESRWENVEIILSEEKPEPGKDYILIPEGHKEEPKQLYSQLKGFLRSVTSWWKNDVSDYWKDEDDPFFYNYSAYDIKVKSIIELAVNSDETPFRWITVIRNPGYF